MISREDQIFEQVQPRKDEIEKMIVTLDNQNDLVKNLKTENEYLNRQLTLLRE